MTTAGCDSLAFVSRAAETLPDDIDALKAALLAERSARLESEARAAGAEAMVAHLKLLIAKMKHDRFGASSERGRKLLDQLEMQLEDLETTAAEADAAAEQDPANTTPVRQRHVASLSEARFRLICRASAWSCPAHPPAPAAAVGCRSWVRA